MSEREEYLKDIAKAKANIEKAKREVEALKVKARSELSDYKHFSKIAISWVDPENLDDIKGLYRIESAIQDVRDIDGKLKEHLKGIEDYIRPRSSHDSPGNIPRLEEDLEGLEDEVRRIDEEGKRKALAASLDEVAEGLQAGGEMILAYAIDRVSDFLDAKKM